MDASLASKGPVLLYEAQNCLNREMQFLCNRDQVLIFGISFSSSIHPTPNILQRNLFLWIGSVAGCQGVTFYIVPCMQMKYLFPVSKGFLKNLA